MSCTPPIIIADNNRISLYKSVANLDVANSLTTGEAINDTVIEFPLAVDARLQTFVVAQVNLREVASSAANIRKPDLDLHLWHGTAPTAPVPNVVYATPVGASYLGVVQIREAHYRRLNEVTWEAYVSANDIYVATDTSGTSTAIFGVLVSAESGGVTFASGAALTVRLSTIVHNTLSQWA
jgi:hypothetical protein